MNTFRKQAENGKTVAVVGTGISGLMEAFALHQAGFEVSVFTMGPRPNRAEQNEHYSSTHNGGLGRFISRFEGEHYLGDSPMYPDMKGAFQKNVVEGGWLAKQDNELTDFDRAWLTKRYQACDDIKTAEKTEQFYVHANGVAMDLWQNLITEFLKFFENADLLNTGILRLYDNKELFGWAVHRHNKESVLERSLIPNEVAKDYPYFSDAVEKGYIAGGVEAPGFSFNIHKFADNIIDYLNQAGVVFNWSQKVARVRLSAAGLVEGLESDAGLIVADNYSLNPGAYADETLFENTPTAGKIAGVAGRWMFMPAPPGFKRPVKIHGDVRTENGKPFPVVDVNLTHFTDDDGKNWLAVGGGYAYLGKFPFSPINPAFDAIDSENDRTVQRYLGPAYRAAQAAGLIQKSHATCMRSFTYDDVPVMDNIPTTTGGILRINAGTNTGTTTISPYTASETAKEMLKAL